ncbi:MAG: hypothetical protein KGI36_19195, partial [Burkholderiales bacterium]|nr:hypothetical protein [Burkholderiales bacterium]
MNRTLPYAAFALGLLVVAWVGAGYLPAHPLPLTLVLLIGACYLSGARELQRYQRATLGLARALARADTPPPELGPWLDRLDPGLRHAVRLRIEGERVALPGPALTPYLVGLLVLLGMLGTFLGMIVTLQGTGLALAHATDVDAIRASLAAPVQGLGLAFGTSVAGVAASAALGLMSAWARRERQRAARQLDARCATTLRGWSRAHQRDEALRLLRLQTEALPALASGLAVLQDRLQLGQDRFHGEARQAYEGLAASVGRALETSLAAAARGAVAAIEPALQATLAGLARETLALRATLGAAVQQQLDGVDAQLDRLHATQAEQAQALLAGQRRRDEAAAQGLQAALETQARAFEQRSAALLQGVTEAHRALEAGAA